MKTVTHARRTHALVRIALATLVGLTIVAVAAGRPPTQSDASFGEFERVQQVPGDATVERADRESPVLPDKADSYPPNRGPSTRRLERTQPSQYDIWIDVRLLVAASRVA
jgi:hypothetical protein